MDEAYFTRDGIQNFHNQRVFADENLHAILSSRHQQWFSINIWALIFGYNFFGSHILPKRLTWRNYKAFLEKDMPDFLAGFQGMTWKLSEIKLWQVFRQYATCQEFGIFIRCQ
jgi:hypothetical protein